MLADDQVFAPGAYIIDMGRSPQTIANGLKPYGLVYDLVRNHLVPVYWAIRPGKFKDAVDFTPTAKTTVAVLLSYRQHLHADAMGAINTWRAKGVVVDGPTDIGVYCAGLQARHRFPQCGDR